MRARTGLVLVLLVSMTASYAAFRSASPTAPEPKPLPNPPEPLNHRTAESVALSSERIHLQNRLVPEYGNDSSGVGCCTTASFASTLTHVEDTYYVRVQYAYYYSTDSVDADAVSYAIYAVAPDTVARIGLGDRRTRIDDPLQPTDERQSITPPQLYIVNPVNSTQTVSVTLTHSGTNTTAIARSFTLSGRSSMELLDYTARRGIYELSVTVDGEESVQHLVINESRSGLVYALTGRDRPVLLSAKRNPNTDNTTRH